jgi:putative ABC transport system permease protein
MPRIFRRLLYLTRLRQLDADLKEELACHHAMRQADLQRSGVPASEAAHVSRRALGNATLAREDARAVWISRWLDDLCRDIGYAVRMLRKGPAFTMVVILTLAVGIGANSAVFTLANAILLRGLPFERPDRIMYIDTRDARGRIFGVSVWDFEDWQRASRAFSALALSSPGGPMGISGDDLVPERYTGGYISANGFDLIGQTAVVGRSFTEADGRPGAEPVVLISNSVWKSRYGGDLSIIGKPVRVNTLPATIIGVMPEGLKWPFFHDVWMPLSQLPPNFRERGRQYRNYVVYGRLADGVAREQAQTEMATISRELAVKYPDTNKDLSAVVTPFAERVITDQFRLLWSLMAAVGFVLLIACANAANLLLARGAHRMREIAVRFSLGATRWRVVRQLLAESVLLALISGVVGLAFAQLLIRWFDSETQAVGKPYWMVYTMDTTVFVFLAGVCLLTGIAFGLVPALHVSNTNVSGVQNEAARSISGSARIRRWTSALVIAELALTLVLLTGAGLMMRSFLNLYHREVGIETSRLLTMSMVLPARKYPSLEARTTFLRRVDERLNTIGAVEAGSTSSNLPLFGGYPRQVVVDGRTPTPGETPRTVTMVSIGPRYFDTIGIRLTRGRPFNAQDGSPGHEAAIIDERLATIHFGNADSIGQRIRLVDDTPGGFKAAWATIVGVVPNVQQTGAQANVDPDPIVYVPHLQNPAMAGVTAIILRGRSSPEALATLLRKEIFALDPDLPLASILTMDQLLERDRWFGRVFGMMFSVFAVIAIVLAAVGLFAVTAYSVMQRRQEIGIRMAFGATHGHVIRQWVGFSMRLSVIGLVLGLMVAYVLTQFMSSMLYGVQPHDPLAFAIAATFVLVTAALAAYIPVHRAARLDPMVALRSE